MGDDIEVTIVLRGRASHLPPREEMAELFEDILECDVLSVDEEEV